MSGCSWEAALKGVLPSHHRGVPPTLSAAIGYVTSNELLVRIILYTIIASPAVLYYLGHSEEGTGNWCFKGGTISFQEIFDLYRRHCPGKLLSILPDCCYSGNWVRECAKTLDSLGIPPCGHRAREQGILIKVFASCQPDQKAAEPCYSVEGVTVREDGTLGFQLHEQASETQNFCGTDFAKLVCCRGPDRLCHSEEALKNWTWQDGVNGGLWSRVHIVRDTDRGQPAWHYVLLSNKREAYKKQFSKQVKSGHVDVAKWGYVIESGWGKDPPRDIKDKINVGCHC